MKKERIDKLLVLHQLAQNIDEARRFIMAGLAVADDKRIDKAGDMVKLDAVIRLKDTCPYVSRGGYKLQKAIDEFKLSMKDAVVIDIGSSTGGFTDVALKSGAKEVFAIDVGENLIHESIKNNERVKLLENTNFRTIDFETIGVKVDFIVTDVSFISLSLIFPSSVQFVKEGTIFIALIKPQFEAEKEEVPPGGVVTDTSVHKRVCYKVVESARDYGYVLKDMTVSPIKGAKGNVEYLAYFVYSKNKIISDHNQIIEREFT